MKILVTGVCGQLGHDVVNHATGRGHEVIGSDIAERYSGIKDDTPVTKVAYVSLDITDREAVMNVVSEIGPDAIIHCAAWTAVDAAEADVSVSPGCSSGASVVSPADSPSSGPGSSSASRAEVRVNVIPGIGAAEAAVTRVSSYSTPAKPPLAMVFASCT